jgi:hypothetical protein
MSVHLSSISFSLLLIVVTFDCCHIWGLLLIPQDKFKGVSFCKWQFHNGLPFIWPSHKFVT